MYFKLIINGYIIAVGIGNSKVEITEAEYNQIKAFMETKPARAGRIDYRLREDLTWEEYEIPLPPPEPEEVTE